MKKGEDLNPKRDYFQEALFKAFGAYFFWLIKGRSTSLEEEMQKDLRNVVTSIIFYVLIFIIYISIP